MGLVHVYYGDGKGKTSAALGLALRAAGNGMRVHLVQFFKGGETGELLSLQWLPQITVSRCDKQYAFSNVMDERQKQEITACHKQNLEEAISRCVQGNCSVLILDEALDTCRLGLLDEDRLLVFLQKKPETVEVVLTGHDTDEKFSDCADYITEMKAHRHPYETGVQARRGIEY